MDLVVGSAGSEVLHDLDHGTAAVSVDFLAVTGSVGRHEGTGLLVPVHSVSQGAHGSIRADVLAEPLDGERLRHVLGDIPVPLWLGDVAGGGTNHAGLFCYYHG